MAIIGESNNQVGLFQQVSAYCDSLGYRAAAFATAQWMGNPNAANLALEAARVAPTVLQVVQVSSGFSDLAAAVHLDHAGHVGEAVSRAADQVKEATESVGLHGWIDPTIEAAKSLAEVATPEEPLAEKSTEIGGKEVDAHVAEIKQLQEQHAAQLKDLSTARDIELHDQALKDDKRAEWMSSQTDLNQEGLKALEDAKAANQQEIVTRYEAEESTLKQQQSFEMGALQAAQMNVPPPLPPAPPAPSKTL